MMKREILRSDLLPMEEYVKVRKARRQALLPEKARRRVAVGPYATFHFETYETMWFQVQEMLYIERGGEEQIAGELEAYNPLIPKGSELVATLMFEIEDAAQRARELLRLGGVEETVRFDLGGELVPALPEPDVERTSAEGKTSSVHFLHFPFTPAQIARFRDPAVPVILGIAHPQYGHMALIQPATREALAADFA